MEFTLLGCRISWDPWFFFLSIFPFQNGNVYPRPTSLLYSASRCLICFMGSQIKGILPQGDSHPTGWLTHIWFRWYLDEILDFSWCCNDLRLLQMWGWSEYILHVRRTCINYAEGGLLTVSPPNSCVKDLTHRTSACYLIQKQSHCRNN